MSDKEVLDIYIKMVPFLSEVLGTGTEVVIHDISDPEHSLIAIGNSLSGRQAGNPMSDLARDMAEHEAYSEKGYEANYPGHNQDKEFLSSTYFIKNEGRLIGMLCINKDMTSVNEVSRSVRSLLSRFNLMPPDETTFSEDLGSPADIMRSRISDAISQSGIQPSRMSRQEKVRIVRELEDNGIMLMRGAAAEIARQLEISIPSVYRYLNTRKKDRKPPEGDIV